MSKNEVQWLTTDGTGKRNMQKVFIEPENSSTGAVTLPAGPAVQIINYADFAIMAQSWMNQELWL